MDAYILNAVRTPFGRYRGGLSHIRPDDLAALVVRAVLDGVPGVEDAAIDDVLLGNTNGAGEENRNVARMAALLAGLPTSVPGATVNRLCASGSEAKLQGARALAVGDARLVVAGGVESMSRAPYVLPRPDEALPRSMELHQTVVGWRMVNEKMKDEWTASLGGATEQVAARYGVTREEMDAFAARSHALATAAWDAGLHDWVLEVDGVTRDESIRPDTTAESLARLKPAFSKDGTITAGNSSPINDGASAVLLGTRAACDELGVEPWARITASATVGIDPQDFALGPAISIRKLVARSGLALSGFDVIEIQEAFAAVPLVTARELPDLPFDRVNPNGGAVAIGHPLGASAPRAIIDLVQQLRRRGGGRGLFAVCIGVGLGQAVAVEVGGS
jgi:acetyl-CoA acyltransferase